MNLTTIRSQIVLSNIKKGLASPYKLDAWGKDFINELNNKINKGILQPGKLTQHQFNKLQEITEGF